VELAEPRLREVALAGARGGPRGGLRQQVAEEGEARDEDLGGGGEGGGEPLRGVGWLGFGRGVEGK